MFKITRTFIKRGRFRKGLKDLTMYLNNNSNIDRIIFKRDQALLEFYYLH